MREREKRVRVSSDMVFEARYFKNKQEWYYFLDQLGFSEEDYRGRQIIVVIENLSGDAIISYDD